MAEEWISNKSDFPELRADVLRAIENTLSEMSVEGLPREELLIYARAARDQVFGKARKARDAEREAKRQRQLEAQQQAARKHDLVRHGTDYARRELESVEDLDWSDKWRIERSVATALQEIDGDETYEDIEDLIEKIFEREGIEFDEDEEGWLPD